VKLSFKIAELMNLLTIPEEEQSASDSYLPGGPNCPKVYNDVGYRPSCEKLC
jgi:hypothetical protein